MRYNGQQSSKNNDQIWANLVIIIAIVIILIMSIYNRGLESRIKEYDKNIEILKASAVRYGYAKWISNDKDDCKFEWIILNKQRNN